jgi:predicted nucleotidyltransferase
VTRGAESGWPPDVRRQLAELVNALGQALGPSLVGVYVHGSLALGCFRPERSDIDVLAVANRPLAPGERRSLGEALRGISAPKTWPRAARWPLELDLITASAVSDWHHPAPYDLHYSEKRREPLGPGTNSDLAAHLTVVHQAGVVLTGAPPASTLPAVPWNDYADALRGDLSYCAAESHGFYSVLSPARIWATLAEREPHTKESAAEWALPRVPAAARPLLADALAVYRAERDWVDFDADAVRAYIRWVERRLPPAT